jgi:hypothetical protein
MTNDRRTKTNAGKFLFAIATHDDLDHKSKINKDGHMFFGFVGIIKLHVVLANIS